MKYFNKRYNTRLCVGTCSRTLIGNLSLTERTGKAIVNSYFLSLRIICEEKDDGFTVSHYQK